jgi:hypothetical protein
MPEERFRIREATVALGSDQTRKRIVVIPAGAEIVLMEPIPVAPVANHNETVSVSWDGRALTMFTIDIQLRGQPVASIDKT